jgi:hypothetical protein
MVLMDDDCLVKSKEFQRARQQIGKDNAARAGAAHAVQYLSTCAIL